MEMISYGEFGQLRLRRFCGDEVAEIDIADWEWMGGLWYWDGVGFTWFGRLGQMPDETGGLQLDLAALPESVWSQILKSLRLPLKAGMKLDEITKVLGKASRTRRFVPDRKTYEFRIGSRHEYRVSCTVQNDRGLIFISVIRQDVLLKITSLS